VGTPIGVQQKLMRHSDIRTTMNLYGDAVTDDMRSAHEKVVRLAMPKNLNWFPSDFVIAKETLNKLSAFHRRSS
jgi:hypothetical protein